MKLCLKGAPENGVQAMEATEAKSSKVSNLVAAAALAAATVLGGCAAKQNVAATADSSMNVTPNSEVSGCNPGYECEASFGGGQHRVTYDAPASSYSVRNAHEGDSLR